MSSTLTETLKVPASASVWTKFPVTYEINTWVWLSALSQKYRRSIDLNSLPAAEWDAIASYGFDAVWFMGVWERSSAGAAIANRNPSLLADFQRTLPNFQTEDNVGSAYCVRRYVVDKHLGGAQGLAVARRELSRRGMNLILDFVPNHVAPDHPWAAEHPEYFIRGTADDLRKDPVSFTQVGNAIYACGRDPYFPAWQDVLQLNAFHPDLRRAVIETVASIAEQCDGIRCDMAMLLLNAIFQRTWQERAGTPPGTEYWSDVITAVKRRHPGFLFVAEAYWGLEWELQQKGFDFCYDKTLYDRFEHSNADGIRLHLCADPAYQDKLVRFIENHDEPRAAATFAPAKERAIAVTMATIPGMKLFYEGQFEGRKVRPPVFLARQPAEPVDEELHAFYDRLLKAIDQPIFRQGEWSLCDRSGWPDNQSFQNLVAWNWQQGDQRYLIVVNLSDSAGQAQVQVPWPEMAGWNYQITDLLSGTSFSRDGDQMLSPGLYVDLQPWNYHFFECIRGSRK